MSKSIEEWAFSMYAGAEIFGQFEGRCIEFLREFLRENAEEIIEAGEDGRDQDRQRSPYGLGCNCSSYARAKLSQILGEQEVTP